MPIIDLSSNSRKNNVLKVRVRPISTFLNEREQQVVIDMAKKGVKKFTINGKTVEITNEICNLDGPIKVLPDLSYDVPAEVKSFIPKNIPEYIDYDNLFQKVVLTLQIMSQVALVGEKGVGKTHLSLAIAEEFSMPVYDISGSRNLTEYELIGHYEIRGGETVWIDGILPTWCRYGGLLILDELSIARPSVIARIHSVFDMRRYIVLKEHNNERIERHENAFAILTFNPPRGEYVGTQYFNIAFLDRFPIIEVRDPTADIKREIIKRRSCLDDEIIDDLIEVAEKVNKEYENGVLRDMVSIRDLIECCRLIANGIDKEGAVKISILNRFMDKNERSIVEEILAMFLD